jgi:hypothetical protein
MDREAEYRAKADAFMARAANAGSDEQRRELELELITKPFASEQLPEKMRRVLDHAAATGRVPEKSRQPAEPTGCPGGASAFLRPSPEHNAEATAVR